MKFSSAGVNGSRSSRFRFVKLGKVPTSFRKKQSGPEAPAWVRYFGRHPSDFFREFDAAQALKSLLSRDSSRLFVGGGERSRSCSLRFVTSRATNVRQSDLVRPLEKKCRNDSRLCRLQKPAARQDLGRLFRLTPEIIHLRLVLPWHTTFSSATRPPTKPGLNLRFNFLSRRAFPAGWRLGTFAPGPLGPLRLCTVYLMPG